MRHDIESAVEELDSISKRVDDSGKVVTRKIWLYKISDARAAPEFRWIDSVGGNQPGYLSDVYTSSADELR